MEKGEEYGVRDIRGEVREVDVGEMGGIDCTDRLMWCGAGEDDGEGGEEGLGVVEAVDRLHCRFVVENSLLLRR